MITKTLTEPQLALWEKRNKESKHLDTLLADRKKICGCPNCNDDIRRKGLDDMIYMSRLFIQHLSDRITDERG